MRRLWVKCMTDPRYARVMEAMTWFTLATLLGVFVLGASTNWQPDYPSVTPEPTPSVIP